MKTFEGFLYGCDPEVFILNEDNIPVPAVGLIPGTKQDPYPVEGGSVQVDGLAAEIGVYPSASFDEFEDRLQSVLNELQKMLPSGFSYVAKPSIEFSKQMMDALPEHAKQLGCEPDINAWTGESNEPPKRNPKRPGLCTGAGHFHIGWTQDMMVDDPTHQLHCFDLVKQLDWFVGAWSILLDNDKVRRSLYGKAGACRVKPYGVEYRVPSNFWLRDVEIRKALWNRVTSAIEHMRTNFFPSSSSGSKSVVKGINESNAAFIKDLSNYYPIPILRLPTIKR